MQLGTLFTVDEALKVGLIDQAAPDLEKATAIAEAQLLEFLKIPGKSQKSGKIEKHASAFSFSFGTLHV